MPVRALLLLSDWSIGHEVNLGGSRPPHPPPTGGYCHVVVAMIVRTNVCIMRVGSTLRHRCSTSNYVSISYHTLVILGRPLTRLLATTQIKWQVSAVVVSPFDSVSFLRAAIQSDVVRGTNSANTTTTSNAGYRQGRRGSGSGSGRCPPFAFFYADGVAIDRGQEERISVKDIAITSSSAASSSASTAAGEAAYDQQRWEGNSASDGSGRKELCVFLRACEPRTKQPTAGHSTGGVLHRWEDLQGGSWGNEVIRHASCFHFSSNGGGQTCRRFVICSGFFVVRNRRI